jgi:hypothetical protein
MPVMALLPNEALYFVPNPAMCRSLRACFELFAIVYAAARQLAGLEDLFADGAFMSLNPLSTINTPLLVAAACAKRFPCDYGVFGLRGSCGGAGFSTIDGDGTAAPLFTDVAAKSAAPSSVAAVLRWDQCRVVGDAVAAVASSGRATAVLGSGETGGHGDEAPVALPHVAVAAQAQFIFVGPPSGSQHVAVYNELLRIEEALVEEHGFVSFV